MTHGVVVGKFYPPHRGHRHLIDVAVSQSDRVTVLVVDGRDEDPPAEARAGWLRELHPDATVEVTRDIERDEDSVAWARATREAVGGQTIDGVFNSEPYGSAWAAAISDQQGSDCENVFVGRGLVQISATQVRSDPAHYWDYIDAPVRAHYVKRVCIVGAESTGSTTLARSLAAACETLWVPEYGRTYTVEKFRIGTGDRWLPSDFLRIALEQNALEDRMAREAPVGIMFCDTDSLATALWEEVYLGSTSHAVWRAADAHGAPYVLYLLTDHAGIPWEDDGLRLGDETRAAMTQRFEEVLSTRGLPWMKVTGSQKERLHQALEGIRSNVEHDFTFGLIDLHDREAINL
jgi:HTH-type transcriptional regulator, transcriptional repressor of NAD biosynthesis genes